LISPLKPILTFFGVKDGKIEATALKRIADSLNNLINTYVAWADTVGQDYSISNFIKWLKNSQGEIVATELRMYALKAATLALNMVFAMFASWAISAGMNAFINWMKNAKTHSEQLISTMEDAHDAAEEAQQDVDDIQQKLDDLDQKVKDIGAEKIEDIVDPQEKAKIQEINNLLETQLRLKKQIADDENNKANKAASDVFNDKSEVVVSNETPTSYAEADPNGIGVTVTPSKNVTRTEALREHTARVNELSDAYVKLMSDENATDEERAQAKKNLEDEISLTNNAGTKVSELADMYETDASKYGDVSAEVQECTDSMQGASDALERANNLLNGTTSVENTNLDAFKSKFKDVIEEIDNGYLSMQEAIAQYKDLSPLQAFGSMTGEAIINIDSDTAHQTEAEATALAKLHEIADANNISFEDLIGAFEQLGIVATSNTDDVSNYASQLEATMGVIDDLQSAYKACSTAVEEYNKYGYLSADALQSLLNIDSQYLSCLDLVDGKLQINKQRYAELLAAQYAQAEVEAIDQAITELNTIAKGDAAEKTQTLTTATEDEKNKLVALCPALEDATVGTGELAAALAAAQGAANGGNAEQIQAQIDAVMGALNTKITLLKKNTQAAISSGTSLGNQLNGFNEKTNKANKNNKSTAKSVTDVSSAFDTLNKAMKEYNQYGYLCADTAKSLVGLEDKFTACLTEQNGKLQINVEQFRKFVKEQLKEANATKDGGKSADEMNKILNYLDQNVDTTTISFEQLTDAIKGYGTAMADAKEKTDAIKSAFSDLYDVGTQKKDNDFGFLDMDAIEKQYQAVRNLYENTDLFTNPKYASALNSETGEVDYNSDAFKQMFADHLKELAASARETGGAAGEYLAQGFEDAAAKIANNVMSIRECIDGIGSSLNYATDRIDHFQSGFSDISDIVTQYNTYGGLSIDNYQKLMSLDDDYIKCLSLEGNQLKFNTEAYKELFIAKLNAMIDEYDAADETKALAQRLRELRDAVIASGDGFTSAEDKAKNFETTLGNIKSLLSDLIGVFEKFNENKSNDLKIQGDAWIDVIDKRIDALNEENDAQERAIELAKLQDEYERAKANKTVHVYGGRGQGFVWKADENAVREAGQNLSDKQREYKKKDEIDRLNKLKDKVQEANNLIGTSWDDYQKKLKYTAEFEAMTFEQMEGHYDGFKNSILDNMRDIQSATNVSDAITNLEKLINTLKTLNDVITFFTSGGVSTDGGGIFGLFNQIKNMFTGENGDFDLGGGFKKMFDGAAKVVSDGWNWITGKNRAGSAALKSDTTATLDILGNTIKVNTGDIQRVSGGFFERLVGAAKDNLGSIGKFFSGA
jgi:DNA-directed RNA polymerase specialized sigma24 family protein